MQEYNADLLKIIDMNRKFLNHFHQSIVIL